jgi:hypothetical protein
MDNATMFILFCLVELALIISVFICFKSGKQSYKSKGILSSNSLSCSLIEKNRYIHQAAPTGFRKFKFGSTLSNFLDQYCNRFTLIPKFCDEITKVEIKDDNLEIGMGKVDSIIYSFYDDELFLVDIYYKMPNIFLERELLSIFSLRYGIPDKFIDSSTGISYRWLWRQAEIFMLNGTISIYNVENYKLWINLQDNARQKAALSI